MTFEEIANWRLRPSPSAMLRKEPFGAMVASGSMPIMNLNDDALAIWDLCDGTRSVMEIKQMLTDEYEHEGLRARIVEFVEFCVARGLLQKEE